MAAAHFGLTIVLLVALGYLAIVVRDLRRQQTGAEARTRDDLREVRASVAFVHDSLELIQRMLRRAMLMPPPPPSQPSDPTAQDVSGWWAISGERRRPPDR